MGDNEFVLHFKELDSTDILYEISDFIRKTKELGLSTRSIEDIYENRNI